MFFRFIFGALRYRRQRLLLAFGALAVAATLATVLFGIYNTVEQRIREEFRGYGANLVARPANGNSVPIGIVEAARKMGADAASFFVTAGRAGNEGIPVVEFTPGPAMDRMTSYWHVAGTRDIHPGECLAGELLAGRLNLQNGVRVQIAREPCIVRGIVSTGGAEDGELLLPQPSPVAATFIEIHASGEREDAVRAALAAQYPDVDFQTVQSVAATESNVVLKIRGALFLLTLLILGITILCVSSNFTEMVIERSKEIGILKALGAAERRIAGFFVSESAALALGAAVCGYAAGVLAAAAIGRQIFGGGFHPEASWTVFAVVAAVMLGVAAIATAIAASRIWGIQAAVVLRGE